MGVRPEVEALARLVEVEARRDERRRAFEAASLADEALHAAIAAAVAAGAPAVAVANAAGLTRQRVYQILEAARA
jgi:hypothetical protein